ncbi:hypothetical protein HanRHA438_Chr09g0413561 [Helianthus annuus]|nr:hypothetical protein HanRHA438_Chr09g0413561 [Helianthus annuus]KAJ0894291.1 hypothetical protein HanPSC8_Chr09g0387391 [Helianthus annuus]
MFLGNGNDPWKSERQRFGEPKTTINLATVALLCDQMCRNDGQLRVLSTDP